MNLNIALGVVQAVLKHIKTFLRFEIDQLGKLFRLMLLC